MPDSLFSISSSALQRRITTITSSIISDSRCETWSNDLWNRNGYGLARVNTVRYGESDRAVLLKFQLPVPVFYHAMPPLPATASQTARGNNRGGRSSEALRGLFHDRFSTL